MGACAAMYDVVAELANASSNLTFGQLVRGDGDEAKADIPRLLSRGSRVEAKADIRRLLSRGSRVCRSSTAAVAAAKTRSRRLKVVETKVYGYETKALLDSGAGPSLISEKVFDKLNLEVDRNPVGLTMADGQRARLIRAFREVSVSFNHLLLTMDFYVMENPPF